MGKYILVKKWVAENGSFVWEPGTTAELINIFSDTDFNIKVKGKIYTVPKTDFINYFKEA